ncbi:protein-tyrosine phosphatase [Hirsutella rhossiliensis]|uniref:Protein-tyrosine phosphatase n=1 Tax=Hirsutella rhossiliensis TaxID=111463 RepID=A0A9P8MQK5_9HYPO|nr:protein-tyrosine phosphatase [Hirsutella rhossiliensis]KAH0959948.1 protein-tyrosine phosphatase [Hirsutella rhossiliensis]
MWLPVFAVVVEALALAQALPTQGPRPWNPFTSDEPTARSGRLSPRWDQPRSLKSAAQHAGFSKFEWVDGFLESGDRLARSSAPYYKGADGDQRLTPETIAFLKQQNIGHIISLNSEANNQAIKDLLRRNNIAYTPLPVKDFSTPTLEDMKTGYAAFREHRAGTLVWCGYGHGRTGTMVTALQVYSEHEKPSPRKLLPGDYTKNHVETPNQIRLLDKLQRSLQPGAFRQAARKVVQGLRNMVAKAKGQATDGHLTRPKLPPKKAGEKSKPGHRPGPKTPKLVADVWPAQTPSKPLKDAPKKFGHGMAAQNLGKPSKAPGLVTSKPPAQPGKKLGMATQGPDKMFFAGRMRPGMYIGNPKIRVP